MKRIGLKQEFHGEGDPNQEGGAVGPGEKDEVTLDVIGGTLSFVVPSDIADEQVLQNKFLERYLSGTLKLENGMELDFRINAGALGIDVRATRSRVGKKRGPRPNRN